MDTTNNVVVVFLTRVIELWIVIPLGVALKLSPLSTAIFAALGSIASASIITFSGAGLRERFLKWRYGTEEGLKKGRMYNIWNNYGVIGLGLLSPLFFGAPLGAALGIVLGADKNRLMLWMIIGIVMWSAGLTATVFLGLISLDSYI
jgi:hypothetical protein